MDDVYRHDSWERSWLYEWADKMKLYDYLDVSKLEEQIAEGSVNRNFHKKFTNLAIYTYSKGCTINYAWNEITCKCRGLIVDTATWDIIARPFEKFFNLGEAAFPETFRENLPDKFPMITDKLDGNLITLYPWAGRWWAASKGSFHSEHADWANNWLVSCVVNQKLDPMNAWPKGHTPVFEMIAEELEHHVVHYGKAASGLYLLALINNETGDELNDVSRIQWANFNDIPYVPLQVMSLDKALTDNEKNAEGYVLSWQRAGRTPFRVKVKFTDFLRLQKLVHHIGPKEILDYMSQPHLQCYLDEVLNPETSHEEFIKYVKAWMERFRTAYTAVETTCEIELAGLQKILRLEDPRKDWAERILRTQYPSVMFAMLDEALAIHDGSCMFKEQAERISRAIWKKVEPVAEQPDDIRSIITQEE